MISRLFTAGVTLSAILATAPVLHAQEEDVGSAAPVTGAAPGRGGLGGLIGVSHMFADADYSEGASPRPSFAASIRYVATDWLRLQFSPGFTWAGYSDDERMPFTDIRFPDDTTKAEVLTQLVPMSLQFQYLYRSSHWVHHLGAGPGLYRVMVQDRRNPIKDPQTLKLHRGVYWGVSGQLGSERFLSALPNTSVEVSGAVHWVFAERDEDFPSGFNSFVANVEFRVGANYYFDLGREEELTRLPPAPSGP